MRFLPIFGEKMAFLSKTNVTIKFYQKLAVVRAKKTPIFLPNFLGENILKIATSVAGLVVYQIVNERQL
jgi:hypothetical protein